MSRVAYINQIILNIYYNTINNIINIIQDLYLMKNIRHENVNDTFKLIFNNNISKPHEHIIINNIIIIINIYYYLFNNLLLCNI